jgi:hypothetical protein
VLDPSNGAIFAPFFRRRARLAVRVGMIAAFTAFSAAA